MSTPPLSKARQRVVLVCAALTLVAALISRNWVMLAASVVVAGIGVGRVVQSRRAESHPPRG
jgi:hypothetical protein